MLFLGRLTAFTDYALKGRRLSLEYSIHKQYTRKTRIGQQAVRLTPYGDTLVCLLKLATIN